MPEHFSTDTVATLAVEPESIPFTRDHERMLVEIHQALTQLADLIGPAMEQLKSSPMMKMFGL